jgi:organic radical activating enzyme
MKFIEVFNTFQGEGPDAGRQMSLVRFKWCNKVVEEDDCPCPWCDTLVRMRVYKEAEFTMKDIQDMVDITKGLMITGGEPTYRENYSETVNMLINCKYDVCNIETNGFQIKRLLKDIDKLQLNNIKVMYSPKIFNEYELEVELETTKNIINNKNLYIKIVSDDNEYVEKYLSEISTMNIRSDQIWLMPEGENLTNMLKSAPTTLDLCEKYKVNFSSRGHIIFSYV